MAYRLGSITLPRPKKFTRTFVELAVERLVMFGKTKKRVQNRKEQFTLEFQYLTPAEVNSILSQYKLNTFLPFSVDEDNLVIPETDVLMDIGPREYPPSGELYRENLQITLLEIQ